LRRTLFAVVLTALLAGCLDQKAWIQKFAPKDDDELARRFINSIRTANYVAASAMLDHRIKAGPEQLNKLHAILDHGEPLNIELIAAHSQFFSAGTASKQSVQLTYQVQFRDAWTVAAVEIQQDAVGRRVVNARFDPMPDSLQALNRVTFQDKSIVHYVVFAFAIAIPLFIITTVVVCVRSRVRRRWLWIIFILLGFGQLQLNWTTGEWALRPLSFLLLGAAAFRAGFCGPWTISIAVPVGAIVFLIWRRRLRRKDEPPPLPQVPTAAPPPI
jgi:hypothetical protein